MSALDGPDPRPLTREDPNKPAPDPNKSALDPTCRLQEPTIDLKNPNYHAGCLPVHMPIPIPVYIAECSTFAPPPPTGRTGFLQQQSGMEYQGS